MHNSSTPYAVKSLRCAPMKRPSAALDGGRSGAVWKVSAPGGMSVSCLSHQEGCYSERLRHHRAEPMGKARACAALPPQVG
jgi:hypothetical protein